MAVGFSCGFFNSQGGDRTYSAEEFGSIFDGVIKDGVYEEIGEQFYVSFDTGRKVKVGTGRAWLNHTWTLITIPQTLTAPAADPLNTRVDAVILTVDHRDDVRENKLSIKKGTASSKSEVQQIQEFTFSRTDNLAEYPLAYVTIEAGASSIYAITPCVGREDLQGPPFVVGGTVTADVSQVYARIENQWNEFFTEALSEFNQIDTLYANYNGRYKSFENNLNRLYSDAVKEVDSIVDSLNDRFNDFMADCSKRFNDEIASYHKRFDDYLASLNHIFQDFMRKHNQGFNDFVELKDKEFEEKKKEWDLIHEDFYDGLREELTDYLRDQEEVWETWFQRIQGQLSDDAATNLQRQIDALSYCYVLANRAILGITGSPVHNRVVFGPYAGVEGSKVTIEAPSAEPNYLNG